MAWAFASCGMHHVPLLQSISEQFRALITPTECELRDAHALMSAMWKAGDQRTGMWLVFEHWVGRGGVLDPNSLGVLYQASDWSLDSGRARGLDAKLAECDSLWRFHDLVRGVTGYDTKTRRVPEAWEDWDLMVSLHGGYRRMAALVQHVEVQADQGDADAVEQALDAFAAVEEGSWLRITSTVGGSSKDIVLSAILPKKKFTASEIAVELGTGVGRSCLRMTRLLRHDVPVVTMEHDPVIAFVARSFMRKAGQSDLVEIWIGHISDLIPRLVEEAGGHSVAFLFMDYRGTRFHTDLSQLEGQALSPGASVVAGGVLRPGCPLYLWQMHCNKSYHMSIWSLRDTACQEEDENIEDWIAVTVRKQAPAAAEVGQAPNPPNPLVLLAWQTDQMRVLAGEGSVETADWSDFVNHSKELYADYGINATPWPKSEI
eukprot:gnl/MRDRNA2_/MRDRNA2_86358_c0_seq7.p1 gnl/MRDRNA2_/MRDRNA2_86358_c0~~gnl/MRDRNA2_/MRDRNA2_86358_c0_seq7.p1  ORF type:complete len:503 (-),score=73.71 gnl/MRDRNA2_/MRDRNA2_86358_c0_seq7:23-1315(-)